MTEVVETVVTYADDEEGFFASDENSEAPGEAVHCYFPGEDDGEDGEPIGWINGRPANEQDGDGDVEMEDAEEPENLPDQSAGQQQEPPDFIPAQVVTDGPVKEWADPLSHYVIDSAETIPGTGGGKGGKRRNAEAAPRFVCFYCKVSFDTEPFHCPHPDSTITHPLPDLEYPFCHATCAKGWATWEVGLPLSATLCKVIDGRAGYEAPVAPAPYELLVNQMGGLVVRDNFITVCTEGTAGGSAASDKATGDARRARHKDNKVDNE